MSGLLIRMVIMLLVNLLALLIALVAGGEAGWFIVGCCAFLTVFGVLSSLSMIGTIGIERMIDESAIGGRELRVRGTATLPFRFPFAYVLITDEWRSGRTGSCVRGAALLLPFGGRQIEFAYKIPAMARGVYRLYRTETEAGDFLHLSGYRKKLKVANGPRVVVYPAVGRRTEYDEGEKSHVEDQLFFGDLREYAEGDSARRIDWKSFARKGKLMTRLPGEEEDGITCLVLDPGSREEAFECVVATAAGYVMDYAEQLDGKLYLFVPGDQPLLKMDANRHLAMEKLAMLNRSQFPSLDKAIREATALVGLKGRLVVVSGRNRRREEMAKFADQISASVSVLYAVPGEVRVYG